MSYVDKAALLARRLPQDDAEIPGVGTVRVRGLSREESEKVPKLTGIAREAYIVATALIEPVMTIAEVTEWMTSGPAGDFENVSTKIGELSGLLESSGQDAYKSV